MAEVLELVDMEKYIQVIRVQEGEGFNSVKIIWEILNFRKRKKEVLDFNGEEWCLKRRFVWLENGDENTKFFQEFDK